MHGERVAHVTGVSFNVVAPFALADVVLEGVNGFAHQRVGQFAPCVADVDKLYNLIRIGLLVLQVHTVFIVSPLSLVVLAVYHPGQRHKRGQAPLAQCGSIIWQRPRGRQTEVHNVL